jgi:hypothetical protein
LHSCRQRAKSATSNKTDSGTHSAWRAPTPPELVHSRHFFACRSPVGYSPHG